MHDAYRYVDEDAESGDDIGEPIEVFDPDFRAAFSFFINAGNEQALFEIESCSGQLKVSLEGLFDKDEKEKYALGLQVYDGGSPPFSATSSLCVC